MKYQVIRYYTGLVLKEYSNKYSAYRYALNCNYACYVRSYDPSTGDHIFLREYIG